MSTLRMAITFVSRFCASPYSSKQELKSRHADRRGMYAVELSCCAGKRLATRSHNQVGDKVRVGLDKGGRLSLLTENRAEYRLGAEQKFAQCRHGDMQETGIERLHLARFYCLLDQRVEFLDRLQQKLQRGLSIF